ncbi:hypothetical protein AGMMS49592_0580 [Endomicrobiia bacterium]|nr:hypothetical protein AGMMS49592_0580 [Endomicrobiia bacterium]
MSKIDKWAEYEKFKKDLDKEIDERREKELKERYISLKKEFGDYVEGEEEYDDACRCSVCNNHECSRCGGNTYHRG